MLEAGTTAETTEEPRSFATAQKRAIYSFNVGDFCDLHLPWLSAQRSHAGILLAHQDQFSIGEQVRRLVRLATALSPEDMHNRVEFLSDWGPDRCPSYWIFLPTRNATSLISNCSIIVPL